MVDSVQVLPAGFRVTDANDNPLSGAKIKFREVGPGATRTVYSDKELTTPLGSTVYTRSDGFPAVSQGSNATTLIYTGNTAYYIEITDSNDVPVFPAKDNVRGALDTSPFALAASTSILVIPVLSKTSNYGVQSADKGKLIAANASGGFITMTLPSAVTVGDGWNIGIRNDGSANQVGVAASQNINTSMGAVTAFSLRPGETVWLESNGASFKISGYTPPLLSATTGIIDITDRVAAAPGSPVAGARYIATAVFVAGSVTTANHDIIEANGQGDWFKITPATDCGWLAFVEDEDEVYQFQGSAWVQLLTKAATQAEQEAASSLLRVVTPARQHFHPGHPKVWASLNQATVTLGTPSYGVSSLTDGGGTGQTIVNFATAFSTAVFAALVARSGSQAEGSSALVGTKATTSVTVNSGRQSSLGAEDSTDMNVACFGDFA